MSAGTTRCWESKARSRRHAFGWKSQPAVTRVKQAVAEIAKVRRRDPALAAEGAVAFLERGDASSASENGRLALFAVSLWRRV